MSAVFKRFMVGGMLLTLLAGCSWVQSPPHPLRDGYDFGDVYRSLDRRLDRVAELERLYCTQKDPLARVILLNSIRKIVPAYPSEGVCGYYIHRMEGGQSVTSTLATGISIGAVIAYILIL